MKKITVRNLLGTGFLILILLMASCGKDVKVSTADEMQTAFNAAGPGSRIILAEGVYTDAVLTIDADGTADEPILISAEEGARSS